MTPCTADQVRLDAFVDGTLPEPARSDVASHLTTCAACRAEVERIAALITAARGLPREIAPGRELWSGIARRLGEDPVGRPEHRTRPPVRVLRPFLALAAALFLMLAGGLMATWLQRRNAPARFGQELARYQEAAATLAADLARDPVGLSEATRGVLDRNLRIVDQAIHEAEQALAEDPGNAALEAMLLARHEQRIDLLQRATRATRQES
jgi:anti-sigma factor RsiW